MMGNSFMKVLRDAVQVSALLLCRKIIGNKKRATISKKDSDTDLFQ